jgi:hypothetical protein
MHDALVDLLDKVDVAVARSHGVLLPTDLDPVARVAADARIRLSYPESIVAVAIAGGTGSGKSSLFNALAGEEVALTGGIRPMTVRPQALVPTGARGAMDGFLDALGIGERSEQDTLPWLCLLDLPDNDSVEVEHRHQVEALLPRVDMVIWVTDPEKYRDASLHSEHIAPLAGYQEQFLFVMNQVDRMSPEDIDLVVADLVEALEEDGISAPEVITTAAQPASGPPIGIDGLVERLELERGRSEAVQRKLLTDLTRAASRLVSASGGGSGVDFEARWSTEMERASAQAREGRFADAGHALAGFTRELAGQVGGETQGRLRTLADDVPSRFISCVTDATVEPVGHPGGAAPNWWQRLRGEGATPAPGGSLSEAALRSGMERAIGDPIRELLAERGRADAAIAELALAVGRIGRKGPG